MISYHGTSEANWKKIRAEGVLWGIPTLANYRYTYLAPHIVDAIPHGPVILAVEYEPTGVRGIDNYGFDPPPGEECWQFSVFVPIPVERVRKLTPEDVRSLELSDPWYVGDLPIASPL